MWKWVWLGVMAGTLGMPASAVSFEGRQRLSLRVTVEGRGLRGALEARRALLDQGLGRNGFIHSLRQSRRGTREFTAAVKHDEVVVAERVQRGSRVWHLEYRFDDSGTLLAIRSKKSGMWGWRNVPRATLTRYARGLGLEALAIGPGSPLLETGAKATQAMKDELLRLIDTGFARLGQLVGNLGSAR